MELAPVICREDKVPEWRGLLHGIDLRATKPGALPSLQPAALPAG